MKAADRIPENSRRRFAAAAFIFAAVLLYLYAFHITGRGGIIGRFDDFMAQDAAQIARNTLRGDIFETKYITPIGYTYLGRLEHHPDYIRYPLPVLVYAALFAVLPDSPATIKILNALLLLLNVFLLARIFMSILERRSGGPGDARGRSAVAWSAALIASFAVLPYLDFALGDRYEMITAVLLLLLVLELVTRRRPVASGIICALLTLSRTNMGLMLFFAGAYVVLGMEGRRERLSAAWRFAAAALLVMSPFIARNLYYTGKPFFSLQQSVELAVHDVQSHYLYYRSFTPPPPVFSQFPRLPEWFYRKFAENLKLGLSFALYPAYWPGWLGLVLCFIRFRKIRVLLATLVGFLIVHIVVVSPVVQISRIYVPIYFLLTALGYLGLLEFASEKSAGAYGALSPRMRALAPFAVSAAISAAVITAGRPLITPGIVNRAHDLAADARLALEKHKVESVYSNSPFGIPWHADVIAIYSPVDISSIRTGGPPECRYFIHIEDPIRPLKRGDVAYLNRLGSIVESGDGFVLYRLDLDRVRP